MRAALLAVLSLFLAWTGLSACSRFARPAAAPAGSNQFRPAAAPAGSSQFTPAAETGPYVVIGHLQHRDRVVTIKSGAQGTVYSVQNKDGKILFENATAAELQAKAPEIHDFIEGSKALSAGMGFDRIMLIQGR